MFIYTISITTQNKHTNKYKQEKGTSQNEINNKIYAIKMDKITILLHIKKIFNSSINRIQ